VFPALNADAVWEATATFWEFVGGIPLAVDNGWFRCPMCNATPQVRWWRWHTRPPDQTIRWRCDVSVKCTGCALIWMHGVALTREQWDARPFPRRDKYIIKWRAIAEIIERAPA
jgi:hypothetical protein